MAKRSERGSVSDRRRTPLASAAFLLGLYVALCLLSGAYLLGVFRLPHDTPGESIGVPRTLFSVVFVGLGLAACAVNIVKNHLGVTYTCA